MPCESFVRHPLFDVCSPLPAHGQKNGTWAVEVAAGVSLAAFSAHISEPRMLTFTRWRLSPPSNRQQILAVPIEAHWAADAVVWRGFHEPRYCVHNDTLDVAENSTGTAFRLGRGHAQSDERASDLPTASAAWHSTRTVVSIRQMYLSAGSSCNICDEKDPRAPLCASRHGSARIFAHGFDTVRHGHQSEDGYQLGHDNGRDMPWATIIPPDKINNTWHARLWMARFLWQKASLIPSGFGRRPQRCKTAIRTEGGIQAHSARWACRVYDGTFSPAE